MAVILCKDRGWSFEGRDLVQCWSDATLNAISLLNKLGNHKAKRRTKVMEQMWSSLLVTLGSVSGTPHSPSVTQLSCLQKYNICRIFQSSTLECMIRSWPCSRILARKAWMELAEGSEESQIYLKECKIWKWECWRRSEGWLHGF
jgi:hypothetical protein